MQSISDLIKTTGLINLDFADVTAVMKDAGLAHMGVGRAAGKNKAEEATRIAINSPGLAPAPFPPVSFSPMASFWVASEALRHCRSVFTAMNSTPCDRGPGAVHPRPLKNFSSTQLSIDCMGKKGYNTTRYSLRFGMDNYSLFYIGGSWVWLL
mgnify:CR=1 FL=1